MKKKTGPASEELTSTQLTEKAASAKRIVVFIGATDSDLFTAHIAAAKDAAISDDFEFFHTTDEPVASSYGVTAPGIAVIHNFDEHVLTYTGDATQ